MPDKTPPRGRNAAIDLLRGVVMVVMTLDHARDFFAGMRGSPTDLATTTPVLFFTRWVTHFCAPVFVFLAGTVAFLQGARRTPAERSWFLLSRGLWLVVLELTVMRLGWTPDPLYRFTLLQVIWVLGWCMVLLAAVSRLPVAVVGALGVGIVALHNTLDGVHAARFGSLGWLWKIVHEPGMLEPVRHHRAFAAYSVLPWFGVMASGFAFGAWATAQPVAIRQRRTLALGLALVVAFVVVRALNVYGDPRPWASQPRGALYTVLSFLNCTKYPPSLLYVLMTLGPALCALVWFERAAESRLAVPLITIGSVPLFYYVAHLLLLRYTSAPIAYARFGASALAPPPGHAGSPELPLWGAYVAWLAAVLALYPPTRWFAALKRRRRDWWLSYL